MEELENIGFDPLMEGLPLNFKVMDIKLDVQTQFEFMEALMRVEGEVNPQYFKENEATMLASEVPLEQRKALLARLSLLDDVEVMRALERYAVSCPDDIKEFARMAAYQSKLFLEGALLGENQVVVVSGLGGEGQKIRFFVVLVSLHRKPLNAAQQQVVQKEVEYQLRQSKIPVESISFEGCYAKVMTLVPLRTNVRRLFEQCIDACNELGEFLERNMVISTVKELTTEELDKITAEEK